MVFQRLNADLIMFYCVETVIWLASNITGATWDFGLLPLFRKTHPRPKETTATSVRIDPVTADSKAKHTTHLAIEDGLH